MAHIKITVHDEGILNKCKNVKYYTHLINKIITELLAFAP
jgi:hypothetical protein